MKIFILAVGELKPSIEYDLVETYRKRITLPLTIREIKNKRSSEAEEADVLKNIERDDYVFVLDERGKSMTSPSFSSLLHTVNSTHKRVIFVIGGADGLTDRIRQRANQLISFGSFTWPHMLVRGLLMEQIYRAQQIDTGHPYHRM
jgi:23S rRNA (pseudouridine1915-N3)-methyltransferase